jgi:cytochrome oxidase Cu insertion factor (SCO1/SenC/PrrC family)
MMPHERSLVTALKDKPFVLLGVNGDKDYGGDEFKKNLEKHGVTWRSFRDAPGGDRVKISDAWNLEGWPTLYLIDAKGVIRKTWLGSPDDEKELDREIEKLLAE